MFAVLAGWLVVDSARAAREHGFLFAGGKINQVLPNDEILRLAKENQYEIFDYRDQVICPGFVNSETGRDAGGDEWAPRGRGLPARA